MVHRVPAMLVLAAIAIAVSLPDLAGAADRAVVPVTGNGACKQRPPVLLSAGRSPRAPLRIDLARLAGKSQSGVDIETEASMTQLAGGPFRPSITTDIITIALSTGRLAGGRVPLTARVGVSGNSYLRATALTFKGFADTLDGGRIAGEAVTDRLPREPVGAGATWRVVNCDHIGQTPAKETRTYTLRSVGGGFADMAYRDVITIDPGDLDAGSQRDGDEVVKLRIVSVHGTATGTRSTSLARGLTDIEHSVSHLRVTVSATSHGSTVLYHKVIVDTDSTVPTS
jgi:hypothetical protein